MYTPTCIFIEPSIPSMQRFSAFDAMQEHNYFWCREIPHWTTYVEFIDCCWSFCCHTSVYFMLLHVFFFLVSLLG